MNDRINSTENNISKLANFAKNDASAHLQSIKN
jgi:hypothetical protein